MQIIFEPNRRTSRLVRVVAVALVTLAGCDRLDWNTQSAGYGRKTEFGPVRLSYRDFVRIATKARNIADRDSSSGERITEQMNASDGFTMLNYDRIFLPNDFETAPPIAYSASYRYSREKASVSSVRITLNDFTREVSVEGQNASEVDAVFSMLDAELRSRTVSPFLTGPQMRWIAGSFFLFVAWMFVWAGVRAGELGAPLLYRWSSAAIGLVVAFSVLALPWRTWLPGAAVFDAEASFVVRYSPQFTFWGFILTVAIPLVSAVFRWFRGRRVARLPEPLTKTGTKSRSDGDSLKAADRKKKKE